MDSYLTTIIILFCMSIYGRSPGHCLAQGQRSRFTKAEARSLRDILTPSLFPNFPPYIKFKGSEDPPAALPRSLKESLIWRGRNVPRGHHVRTVVENTGFKWVRRDFEGNWTATWGSPADLKGQRGGVGVLPWEKWNHFPGSGELSNKDRMWINYRKDFPGDPILNIPPTFVMPTQLGDFRAAWERTQNKVWIEKSALGSRGSGIRIVKHWNEINGTEMERRVVQKYIHNLLLINGSRNNIRLHAVVTSYYPLRLYMFRNMMVLIGFNSFEFGPGHPCRYNPEACGEEAWDGPKLEEYLQSQNLSMDMSRFWAQVDDITIKVVLAAADRIRPASKKYFSSAYNAYEILGIDILLDQDFVPYLLEVNTDPCLRGIPEYLSQGVVSEAFTLAGLHLPPNLDPGLKERIKGVLHTANDPTFPEHLYRPRDSEHRKSQNSTDAEQEALSEDDLRHLIIAEDELSRAAVYRRIFPSGSSWKYLKYLAGRGRKYNRLYADWEKKYGEDRPAGIQRLRQLAPRIFP